MNRRYTHLIIGGGIAGTTAAEIIRMHDDTGTIAIISDEPHPLYSRILLPLYLRDEVQREGVFLRTLESYKEKRIELLLGKRVTRLHAKEKRVVLDDGSELTFDKCLIASGGRAREWEINGKNVEEYFELRTIDDADRIREHMAGARHVIVVGGGFIGLEFIESFLKKGIKTTVILREPYYFAQILPEAQGRMIGDFIQRAGAEIFNSEEITEIERDGTRMHIRTRSGRILSPDFVAVGIGIQRTFDFVDVRIRMGEQGIRTNEFLETSVPDIFAAGDVAEFNDLVLEKVHALGNWTNAMQQGRIAALNMAGQRTPCEAVSAYSITFFDVDITFLGDTTSQQKEVVVHEKEDGTGSAAIFLEKGKVRGASLVNFPEKRKELTEMIRNEASFPY